MIINCANGILIQFSNKKIKNNVFLYNCENSFTILMTVLKEKRGLGKTTPRRGQQKPPACSPGRRGESCTRT